MPDNICLLRYRRPRSILIFLLMWRLILILLYYIGITCLDIVSISLKCRAGITSCYTDVLDIRNIIALLFNRQLLIGSVSAWKISSLLIKICITGSRWSLWIGISSRIKVYLIDLLSGNVHKALTPLLRLYLIAFIVSDASCFLLSFHSPRGTGLNHETSAAQILPLNALEKLLLIVEGEIQKKHPWSL